MPPQSNTDIRTSELQTTEPRHKKVYKWTPNWRNIILNTVMHITAVYGFYLCFSSAQWKTPIFGLFILVLAILGMTAGTHRLWSHRSYKAKLPLQILLVVFQTLTLQNHAYQWASYHRIHHKYVDTEADPHNSRRGFFYSHIGWLLIQPEREFLEKYNNMNFHDMQSDKLLMFQKKYYFVLFAPIIGILIPTVIPCYFWGETLKNSFFIVTMLRYGLCSNSMFVINSIAHIYGTRPYDKNILPTESLFVSAATLGEGWHNYHHTFPWDYRATEFGKHRLNLTTSFINLMSAIGWAYDLKTVSEESITRRSDRTGDGTRKIDKIVQNLEDHQHNDDLVWGWGDQDMTEEYLNYVKISNRKMN